MLAKRNILDRALDTLDRATEPTGYDSILISIETCLKEAYKDLTIYFYLYGNKTATVWRSIF